MRDKTPDIDAITYCSPVQFLDGEKHMNPDPFVS